jgi:hypothetical protein
LLSEYVASPIYYCLLREVNNISQQYTLVLLPFEAAGFQSACTEEPDALLTEKVTIVTAQTPGIKPRSLAPPGYIQKQGGDYDKAVGYLENGNQRFFQRHGTGVGLG